jgi:glycosyltransferase involved in cell wall biosynthesis
MAVGTPVACTRAGSLQEVADGATFAIKDPTSSSIADAIRSALSSTGGRQEMIEAGFERARHFSWEHSLAAHKDVFERV